MPPCMICDEGSLTDDATDRELCSRHFAMLPRDLRSEWQRALPWAGDDLRRRVRMLVAHLEGMRD